MITLAEAREKLLSCAPSLRPVALTPRLAEGFVLAERLVADRPIPPFNRAAMDGYAVRSADLGPEGGELACVGEIRAGDDWTEALLPGTCVAIMTGAAVPAEANAVIEVEATESTKGRAQHTTERQAVSFRMGARPGRNIAPQGEDALQGDVLLEAGIELNAVACGLLATCGVTELSVYGRPSVALLSTGNEVVDPGTTPAPHQIRDANRTIIAAMLYRYGFESITDLGIAPDDPGELRRSVSAGLDHDVLVLSGGVSMGTSDIVPDILTERGVKCLFAGVAIKPGKPLWAGGNADGRIVLAMPGNPLAVLVHASEMLVPLLRKMAGHAEPMLPLIKARLTEGVVVKGDRLVVQAAVIGLSPRAPLRAGEGGSDARVAGSGGFVATPLPSHGSADLVGAARANGLIFLPPDRQQWEAGDAVEARLWW